MLSSNGISWARHEGTAHGCSITLIRGGMHWAWLVFSGNTGEAVAQGRCAWTRTVPAGVAEADEQAALSSAIEQAGQAAKEHGNG